jgi:PAS domain S-box-containing protein
MNMPIKIVAIDDNSDNRITLKALLTETFPDVELHLCASGSEGIEKATAFLPDVILLDILMPGMDGFEVCRLLKSSTPTTDIPVVFLTALKDDKECRIKALECGGEAFLTKPIDPTELTAQIRAMVKIRKANIERHDEKTRLQMLVEEKTSQLLKELEEKKKIVKTLRKSEERFKYMFEATNAGKSITLPSGEIHANQAFCDMLGYSKEELREKKWQELTPEEDILHTEKIIAPLLDGKEDKTRFTKRYIHKNGNLIWADVSTVIVRDKNRQPLFFLTTLLDITERIKAEELLKESEVQYRNLANSANALIWCSGTDKLCYYFNQTWIQFTGRTLDQELGNGWVEGVHPADFQYCLDIYTNAFDQRQAFQMDYRLRHHSGEYRWIRDMGTPNFDRNGTFIGYIGHCFDITEQKKMEISLKAAKEKAEESDRLKSAFLANMSHEIRTPMNSIMGFASLLPEEESRELMCQYAKIIVQNSEQLVHIIDDIVLYSRLQAKILGYYPRQFNLYDLLYDLKQSFNLPEYTRSVELVVERASDDPYIIKTDYEKLRQIFVNLISNAFKYTLSGTITIGFKLDDHHAVFFVKDTGIGIPESEIEKVFERFYRGSNTRRESISGTGLGLSIVKELIELLGGSIWIESKLGEGSIFWFSIPVDII